MISLSDSPDLQFILQYLETIWLLGKVLDVKKLAKQETHRSCNRFYKTTKLYNLFLIKSIFPIVNLEYIIYGNRKILFSKSIFNFLTNYESLFVTIRIIS